MPVSIKALSQCANAREYNSSSMAVSEFRAALQAALPAGQLARLRQVQQVAAELDAPTYLVGGVARDLVLGRPPGDLDLVVQARSDSDDRAGPRLAQALARQQGGAVTVPQSTISSPDRYSFITIQNRSCGDSNSARTRSRRTDILCSAQN